MKRRSSKGAPDNNKKECKGTLHTTIFSGKKPKRTHKVTSHDFSKRHINYLRDEGLLGMESTYVCDLCLIA